MDSPDSDLNALETEIQKLLDADAALHIQQSNRRDSGTSGHQTQPADKQPAVLGAIPAGNPVVTRKIKETRRRNGGDARAKARLAENKTSDLPRDRSLTAYNLPPEAAHIELPPEKMLRYEYQLDMLSLRDTPADPHRLLLPDQLCSSLAGYQVLLYRSRGFTYKEMVDRTPEQFMANASDHRSKPRSNRDRLKGAHSTALQRWNDKMGLLGVHMPDNEVDSNTYVPGHKAFDVDRARLSSFEPLNILFNVSWEIHADGTMTCPCPEPPRRSKATAADYKPPDDWVSPHHPLPAPQEPNKRFKKLLKAAGVHVPQLAVLPVIWHRAFGNDMPKSAIPAWQEVAVRARFFEFPCEKPDCIPGEAVAHIHVQKNHWYGWRVLKRDETGQLMESDSDAEYDDFTLPRGAAITRASSVGSHIESQGNSNGGGNDEPTSFDQALNIALGLNGVDMDSPNFHFNHGETQVTQDPNIDPVLTGGESTLQRPILGHDEMQYVQDLNIDPSFIIGDLAFQNYDSNHNPDLGHAHDAQFLQNLSIDPNLTGGESTFQTFGLGHDEATSDNFDIGRVFTAGNFTFDLDTFGPAQNASGEIPALDGLAGQPGEVLDQSETIDPQLISPASPTPNQQDSGESPPDNSCEVPSGAYEDDLFSRLYDGQMLE